MIELSDKRKGKREVLSLPTVISRKQNDKPDYNGVLRHNKISAHMLNLSPNGVCLSLSSLTDGIAIDALLNKSKNVQLDIHLAEYDSELSLEAQPIWNRVISEDSSGKVLYQSGFEFIGLTDEVKNLIADYLKEYKLVGKINKEQSYYKKKSSIIIEPLYSYGIGDIPRKPTLSQIFKEWVDAINFIKYPTRRLTAISLAFHVLTLAVFVQYLLFYLSVKSFLFLIGSIFFLATVYNTIWFHRYCSHAAFTFRKPAYQLLFLWTNPFLFREECYAIPHQIHHQRPEKSGDPYGPHLGWLGSYLATESQQKLNIDMTKEQYESVKASIGHIGIRMNSYDDFKRTGSVENVRSYITRALFAQLLFGFTNYFIGGKPFVFAGYSAVFITYFLMRDFNWWGHGGNYRREKKPGWEFDNKTYALNQRFYGYLASEWHDNHHRFPMSANNGFLPGQIDVAFWIIKVMQKYKIVESYIDANSRFKVELLIWKGSLN